MHVCVYVINGRPHRWSHRPQTWPGGPSLCWEGLRRVKVRLRGHERFSAWREAPARLFGRKMSRRAPLRNKQSQNLAPSMDEESEQIARKVTRDITLNLRELEGVWLRLFSNFYHMMGILKGPNVQNIFFICCFLADFLKVKVLQTRLTFWTFKPSSKSNLTKP